MHSLSIYYTRLMYDIMGASLRSCSVIFKDNVHQITPWQEFIIPSEARLYSGSVDLFRGHGHGHGHGGHGPPLYPATSLAIAYQTRSEHLPSL